jgi:hypothetical protein
MSKAPKSLQEMAAEASNPRGGLECPKCGCKDFEIYKTIKHDAVRFRYKSCRHCGQKVMTSTHSVERIVREVSSPVADEPGEDLPPLMMFAG